MRRCPPWNLQPVQSTFAAQFWSQFRKYEIVSNCDIVCFTRICPVFVWGLPITVFESRKEICGPAIWGSDEWGIFRHGGISHAGGKAVSTLASTQMLMSLNVNLVSTVCYTSFWLSRVHEGEKPATAIGLAFKFPSYLFQISAAGATVRRSLHRQMRREEKNHTDKASLLTIAESHR